MLKKTIILLILITSLFADAGDKKVKLSGLIKGDQVIKISPRELEKIIETSTFELYNPWDKEVGKYTGILLDKFATYFGKDNVKQIKFIAIDDYRVEINKEFWNSERILLVTRVNGKYISLKERGPLRIMFVDYDVNKKKYEKNLPLWLWMIKKIEFQ